MGGTISITLRDSERVSRVCELYRDRQRMKEMFDAIIEHGTEVENIAHRISLTGGKTIFLADAICYISKRVDPFMANFFHGDLLNLRSNAISQIATAAFDHAVKMDGSLKRKKSFVKAEQLNHKFAELKFKYFPSFIAALLFFDHLWELFDLADDNIDDDSIFLGEFMRVRTKIEQVENVKFLVEVSEESWRKEFNKIDNGDEQDGWISFLEFARYACAKIVSPDDYINKKNRLLSSLAEEKSPVKKTMKTQKIVKPVEPIEQMSSIASRNGIQSGSIAEEELDPAVDDGVPKTLMRRYNDKLNDEARAVAEGRSLPVFKARKQDSEVADDPPASEIEAALRVSQTIVLSNRNTAFLARLKRDEDQIITESEAAEKMDVSVELSQELLNLRISNEKMGNRPVRVYQPGEITPQKQSKRKHKKGASLKEPVGPFSFSGVGIHHVKPHSYAAQHEANELLELQTYGRPLGQSKNTYVDNRTFSINNLTRVMKILKSRTCVDTIRQESSGLLSPRPRASSLETSDAPLTDELEDASDATPTALIKQDTEETKAKAKFRERIENNISRGRSSSPVVQLETKTRPKSASSIVSKTSFEEFEKQSSLKVKTFFDSYAKVDRGHDDQDNHIDQLASRSLSLALSSHSGGIGRAKRGHAVNRGLRGAVAVGKGGPYIDDVAASPHMAHGKCFIDQGKQDKKRFGNVRFGNDPFMRRPRSGHFPSRHDTLHGQEQHDLWESTGRGNNNGSKSVDKKDGGWTKFMK